MEIRSSTSLPQRPRGAEIPGPGRPMSVENPLSAPVPVISARLLPFAPVPQTQAVAQAAQAYKAAKGAVSAK